MTCLGCKDVGAGLGVELDEVLVGGLANDGAAP